jgi:parallel beta-helix repeat protein
MKKIIIILLCATLIVNFFGFVIPNTAGGYITHSPIYIDGNADFTSANGVKSGSGTQSDPYIIEGWDIKASSTIGIYIRNTDAYFIIRNCYVHDGRANWHFGIFFSYIQNGRIENTTSTNNLYGIGLGDSCSNTIYNNIFSSNIMADGIYLSYSSNYNIIANNKVLNNGRGIYIGYSSGNIIINNNISSSNCDFDIYLRHSNSNIIADNIISSHSNCGMLIFGSDNNRIVNNTALNNWVGISIQHSSGNAVVNNTITNNRGCGIGLSWFSYNNTASNNIVSNTRHGVYVSSYSSYSTVDNNTFKNSGIFIEGNFNTQNIDTTNTANGKPIYYCKNQKDVDVDGWSVGQVILFNCTNFTIKNVDCSNTSVGVELACCDYCSIEDSIFNNGCYGVYAISSSYTKILNNSMSSNSDYGIWMGYSGYNNISNNIVNSNDVYGMYLKKLSYSKISNNIVNSNKKCGMYLRSSRYNVISNNNASNNHNHYWGYGIKLEYSRYNIISNNNAFNNTMGILLEDSGNNNIFKNNASNNWAGIWLRHSSGNNISNNDVLNNYYGFYFDRFSNENQVYHNNFIDNVNQAKDCGASQWDDGYPSSGNYWSDYTGIDEKSGPNQDQPGSDGIGDTPYNITGGANKDRYPLMYPWGKPKISVEKEFIPSEITTISRVVISSINITNIGDVNITSMTVIDEYVENMRPNDPAELLVTITSDEGEVYAVMPEDLDITFTENNITISFELPLEVLPVYWENGTLQFGEETYYLEGIPKDWVVGVQYLLYPVTELEMGTYYADTTVTAYGETGKSTTETATGILTVSLPIELAFPTN